MLGAGLPIRCAALSAPGSFDTHDSQADSFDSDIAITADSIAAFQADLEARGLADRVITLVWSEFGRRPEENDSGTDHGAAGAGFVVGTQVRGEMIGEFPGLAQLDADDNVRNTSDFRGLYCSIIEQWFGVDAGAVIPDAAALRPAGADSLMARARARRWRWSRRSLRSRCPGSQAASRPQTERPFRTACRCAARSSTWCSRSRSCAPEG